MNVQSSASLKRLNHLQCEMSVVYHEMSHLCSLSDSTMQILYTICNFDEESCLLHDICRLTGLPKQTINSALRKLENEDIIFLETANAKNKRVFLTQKGKQLSSETAEKIIDAENRILADWGPETSEQYLALNERYLKCLQKELQRMKAEK